MTGAPTQAKPLMYKNPYLTTTTVGFLSFESQNPTRMRIGGSCMKRAKLLVNFVKVLASGGRRDDLDQRGCDVATRIPTR
jgi:hypothetical protein